MTLADICLILGALLALLSSGSRIALIKAWMVLPALLALVLMARDVIIFGRPINGTIEVIQGISPSQMLLRITLSTLCVAVLCIANTSLGRPGLQRLVGWWLLGIAISAAYSIGQSAGILAVGDLVQLNGSSRFAGLTSHPNALAQTLVLALPFALLVPGRARFGSVLARVLGLVLCGVALYQSGSRAGLLVGFVAVLLCGCIAAKRAHALRWVLPLVLLAFATATIYGPGLIAGTRFASDSGSTASNTARVQALSEGWDAFLTHPLVGAGLGVWVGELAPLVLLVSGGATFLAIYTVFVFRPISVMLKYRSEFMVTACVISASLVPVLGLLNNGFTERYSFWPALLGYSLALIAGSRREMATQAAVTRS
ncbi:O-antigen ligase [Curtobacterium sp. MCPF17_046]|uniref:O-antigen ligase family protein n=1 Tax=Curtobacterium sp. MCPF17_046 TaxID=2175663 RepID=UPI000D8096BD|nr:O-antigen ligase family protein [Curtobacterium sp. MCPF17_046]PYY38979.1 hypothetical protein DEJ32_09895 [Curtobacterium sp. MCPF17_046]